MLECFEISIITDKKKTTASTIERIFNKEFSLKNGENHLENSHFIILNKRAVLLSIYDNKDCNFIESVLSFSDVKFHKNSFENEFEKVIKFIDFCFKVENNILYAFCSYELNGYLLGEIKKWQNIDKGLMLKFPIVFINPKKINIALTGKKLDNSNVILNFEAQEIF